MFDYSNLIKKVSNDELPDIVQPLLTVVDRGVINKILAELKAKTFYIAKNHNEKSWLERRKLLTELLGSKNAGLVMKAWDGRMIYIPTIKHMGEFVHRFIADHSEYNDRQIAAGLDVTEGYIRGQKKKMQTL